MHVNSAKMTWEGSAVMLTAKQEDDYAMSFPATALLARCLDSHSHPAITTRKYSPKGIGT